MNRYGGAGGTNVRGMGERYGVSLGTDVGATDVGGVGDGRCDGVTSDFGLGFWGFTGGAVSSTISWYSIIIEAMCWAASSE